MLETHTDSANTVIAVTDKLYFSFERLKLALEHLGNFSSANMLPTLVFACKGVNSTDAQDILRADDFLDKFFSGKLISLTPLSGGDALRPVFSELKGTVKTKGNTGDLALHQSTKLWANAYSSRGYREWIQRGFIEKTGTSTFKLTPTFQPMIEAALAGFHFEELLVWLYAFSGIPSSITSWSDLFNHFQRSFCLNELIPPEYAKVFNVSSALPWPTDFLNNRPSNEDYQELLFPSSFISQIPNERWKAVSDAILTFIETEYDGLDSVAEIIAKNVTAAISTERRLFILGDPGTGKSSLSKAIANAFSSVFGDDRLLIIQEEITDETSQQSLLGFCTVNGQWVNGTLTAAQTDKKQLLYVDISDKNIRSQINLILLEEANRKDIEGYLAKLQSSLDSKNDDPKSNDHKIRLEGVGDKYISPRTYIIMTGNSPKDDEGRMSQSRPQKRRQGLCIMPNPYSDFLKSSDTAEFTENIKDFWNSFGIKRSKCSTKTKVEMARFLSDPASTEMLDAVGAMWRTFAKFRIGVSYGLIEKYLRIAAQLIDLDEIAAHAFDQALVTAVGPLLSNARAHNNEHIRKDILTIQDSYQERLPGFYNFVEKMVDDPDSFGQVQPFL